MKKQILRITAVVSLFVLSLACFTYLNLETQRRESAEMIYPEEMTAEDPLMDVRLIKEVVQKAVQFITVSRF